ncbi:SPFH domain-containing protein [Streptomyces sp. NBC_00370]|uniref:SPFH domain-containing protein n=1 Tax=Streptomyces sp. NBC_00370 TaxID=2975728 RepID=UPI003FA7CC14
MTTMTSRPSGDGSEPLGAMPLGTGPDVTDVTDVTQATAATPVAGEPAAEADVPAAPAAAPVAEPFVPDQQSETPTPEPVVAEAPAEERPPVSEPVVRELVSGEPVTGELVVSEPVVGEPAVDEPVLTEPAPREPALSDTAVIEAVVDEAPVAELPFGDAPVHVVPVSESRVNDTRAADGRTTRWSPLIVGESTHEIPVHLLFRDEARAVAGQRQGTGEQPRVRRVPAPAGVGAVPARPATPVDTRLVERAGPVLPGWAAAFVGLCALVGCAAVLWWAGAVPAELVRMARLSSHPYHGIGIGQWVLLTLGVLVVLFTFGGLGRGRVGHAWVLTLFGEYRGSVRRTGLLWVSPLLLRRRVDVRLRHWRSEPMPAVDANGTALRVVVLVVWRVMDTVQATLGVRDHEEYLREQVEAAMARVLSQLPADAFHETVPTLRDAEAVGAALTRMLSAECRSVGVDVFSAQPTRIEYAPEIAEAMQRSRIAALDARHRDSVLTAVVDAVDDTVHRLTSRGLVELDDYERKALVKDLTVAFYTGRHAGADRF